MAQIVLGGLTTLNLATHLDPMFTSLFDIRERFRTPSYTPSVSQITLDASGNFFVGGTASTYKFNVFGSGSANVIATTSTDASGVTTAMQSAGSSAGFIGTFSAHPLNIVVGGAARLGADLPGNFYPAADNTQSCGRSPARWSVVYAGTGTINTSDAREKTDVRKLNEQEISAAKALCAEIGVFRFLSSVSKKGDDARDHIGLTVQRAIEIMSAHGLSPFRYAFICYDKWPEKIEPAAFEQRDTGLQDSSGNPVIEKVEVSPEKRIPGGDLYGFRYDQLVLFIMRGLEARIAALEA